MARAWPGCSAMRRWSKARVAPFRSRPAISAASLTCRWSGRWRIVSRRRSAPMPAQKGTRKVVLATSIAETSLTIEGVRIVVDSGLSRVPRYEPDIALTRLETVRASRAAVDPPRGRAGRTEPGVCYRLWDEPQTAALAAYTQPEILSAELSSLLLH